MTPEKYLWLDFETTGLDPYNTTLLEVAWTVTDRSLVQLTPLRSRFLYISTSDAEDALCPVGGAKVGDETAPWAWNRGDKVDLTVRRMHHDSGLRTEWLAEPTWRVIRNELELNRVMFDDLYLADWSEGDPLFLAGAGVSHYDRLVIDAIPNLLALPGSHQKVLHYRAADVSAALQLLGMGAPKTPDELFAWERRLVAVNRATEQELLGVDDGGVVSVHSLTKHRAAADVMFALVSARCMRAMMEKF